MMMDCFSMISRGSQRCRFLETCWPLHLLLNLPLAPNPKCQPRIYVPFEKKSSQITQQKNRSWKLLPPEKKNVWQERLRQWKNMYIYIYIDINIYIYISYHNVFISIYIHIHPIIMYILYIQISDFGSKKKNIFWLAF